MSLTWHIVKKDLRRMAGPLALWCAFILAGACWFRFADTAFLGNVSAGVTEWTTLLRIWAGLLTAGETIFAVLLMGALILEDPVVGTNAFWPTRPIRRSRLLAAKTITVVIGFVIAPLLVLLPIWWSVGGSLSAIGLTAFKMIEQLAVAAVVAVSIASIAGTLAQFLFTSLGVAAVGTVIQATLLRHSVAHLRLYFAVLPVVLAVLVMAAFVVRRGYVRALVFLAATAFASVSLRLLGLPADSPPAFPAAVAPEDLATAVHVHPRFTQATPNEVHEVPTLSLTTAATAPFFYAPGFGRDGSGMVLAPSTNWGDSAGLRVLGIENGDVPLQWRLLLWRAGRSSTAPHFTGSLDVWRTRAVVVGELELRVGAELGGNLGRVRIVALEHDRERIDAIWLEERQLAPTHSPSRLIASGETIQLDAYFLRDPVTHKGRALYRSLNPEVEMNGQCVRFTRLYGIQYHPDGMKLVWVRFVGGARYELPIDVQGVETRTIYKDFPSRP